MAQDTDKTCVTQVMVKQETLQEVLGETLEQTDMVKSQKDFSLSHDCPQGNLIVDVDTQLSKRNHDRRKYLFSPRHFENHNDFTFSLKTPKYSHKNKNKINTIKPVKVLKQNSYDIRTIRNISGLNLKLKVSNLRTPLNKSDLPIKTRIKNAKFQTNIRNDINHATMSLSSTTLTTNSLPQLSIMSTSPNNTVLYDHVRDLYIPCAPMLSDVNLLLK